MAVIILHVAAPILYLYGSIPKYDWWLGNIVDSAVRFCVPIFLMLTGALILPRTYELGEFLKKRFSRILIPFLFWSLVYIMYNLFSWNNDINLSSYEIIKYTINAFKNGAFFHLWYIYLIIGIYLFIPIISKWIINSTKNEITYYVIVWFLVILINLPLLIKYKPALELSYFSGYLGYPVLGYLLTIKFTELKNKAYPILLFTTGFVVTIIGTYYLTKAKGEFHDGFYSYLSPNVMIASIGVFLFFKHSTFNNKNFTNVSRSIGKYSLGIYLAHAIVLDILSKIGISWSFINPIIGIPLTTILCLFISWLTIYSINKIPYGKLISG